MTQISCEQEFSSDSFVDATPEMFDAAMQAEGLSPETRHYLELLRDASPEERRTAMQLDELSFAEIGGLFEKREFVNEQEVLEHYNNAVQRGMELSGDYVKAYTLMGVDASSFQIDVEEYMTRVQENIDEIQAQEAAKQERRLMELNALEESLPNVQDVLVAHAILLKALELQAEQALIRKIWTKMEELREEADEPKETTGYVFLCAQQEVETVGLVA